MDDPSRRVYGGAAIALGLITLVWGKFVSPWQPVPAGLPYLVPMAFASGGLFILCGLALQWTIFSRFGGLTLAGLFGLFALLWIWRIVRSPGVVAFWSGSGEEVALCLGGLLAGYRLADLGPRRRAMIDSGARVGFGLCLLAFGAAHIVYGKETAAMVPAWMPPSQQVWAYATGAAHLLAGLAFIFNLQTRLAASLTTVMFAIFGALVWAPMLFSSPGDQETWGGNAINLGLTAAAALQWEVARRRASAGLIPGLEGANP